MLHASPTRALLRRLHPWIGRAVHARWRVRRSVYQRESEALLVALAHHEGALPTELALRVEGFLGHLHREWFPPTWRRHPTHADVVKDFRWWLDMAERWRERRHETAARPRRQPGTKREPLARQPATLLRLLRLPANATQKQFLAAWRRFVKRNHPDHNPHQTPEERRRFAEAVALRRR
jgi:hypothetical protein